MTLAGTPSAMPYPGDIVSARIARHRRHMSAKTDNPAIPLSPRPHTLLPRLACSAGFAAAGCGRSVWT
jgi:hypothetical protein